MVDDNLESNDYLSNNNDMIEVYPLKSKSPPPFIEIPPQIPFLQNIVFKSFPSFDFLRKKESQIKNKSSRFLKVSNDLSNKINLLEEIYDGPEYKKLKTSNKLIECNLDVDAPYKQYMQLISKQTNDNDVLFDRTVHPAYSNDDQDDEQTMDSSGLFKVPSTPNLLQDSSNDEFSQSFLYPTEQEQEQPTELESLFLEHDGNTYIRVDDINYHLVQSFSEDGVVITETGLQIIIPPGTEIPMNNAMVQSLPFNNFQSQQQDTFIQDQNLLLNSDPFLRENKAHNRKTQRSDNNPYFGHLSYQSPNPVKLYSDYVALPLRPAPLTPFTLSSQLYTPELSISLTEQESELMLTIDSTKKTQPQQQPIYYQIYSYKDEDRYAKPTSEVWGLVGEIKSCPLPMYCTISIPSGFHKHYFAIRSVDEFSRFSDWSNVVQVEVENNQTSPNNPKSTNSR